MPEVPTNSTVAASRLVVAVVDSNKAVVAIIITINVQNGTWIDYLMKESATVSASLVQHLILWRYLQVACLLCLVLLSTKVAAIRASERLMATKIKERSSIAVVNWQLAVDAA